MKARLMLIFVFKINDWLGLLKHPIDLFLFISEDQFFLNSNNQFRNLRISKQLPYHGYRSYSDRVIRLNVSFIIDHYGTEKPLLVLTSVIIRK